MELTGSYWINKSGEFVKCHILARFRTPGGNTKRLFVRMHDTWSIEEIDPGDLIDRLDDPSVVTTDFYPPV